MLLLVAVSVASQAFPGLKYANEQTGSGTGDFLEIEEQMNFQANSSIISKSLLRALQEVKKRVPQWGSKSLVPFPLYVVNEFNERHLFFCRQDNT